MKTASGWSEVHDAPEYTILGRRTSIARTAHSCSWCGRTITPGQMYHREVGVLDGAWFTVSRHAGCHWRWS